jgi:choline-sulfatase
MVGLFPSRPRLRSTTLIGRLGALACLGAVCGGCSRPGPPPPPAARHLVLVTIDTLRADHVGAYGGDRSATPRLDAIAAAGAIAPEASAHAPLTLPSHASLFAGRLPPALGIHDNISARRMPDVPLLAEVLKKTGFATGGFVSSIVLGAFTGLDRGFDVYSDEFETQSGEPQLLSMVQKRGDVVTSDALEWLARARARPADRIFLWVHLFDPHDPYEPPEPYASRYSGRAYQGEVAWTDELVGRLDDGLARLGMRGETLLVVTSDHGEGLGDHGELLHGYFVYQSTLRVPFLVRGPGILPGTRLGVTLRLVDVYPTVLEMLGVQPPVAKELDGRSLASALRGGTQPEEAGTYAESLVPLVHFGWSDLRVLREGKWKYIAAPRPELYDLTNDPGETTNVVAAHRPRVDAMRGALGAILARENRTAAGSRAALPVDQLERLGALGYVGVGASPTDAAKRPDPKDKLDDFRAASELMREGLLRMRAGDHHASVAAFRAVAARGVQGAELQLFLARSLLRSGKPHEAVAHFEQAVALAPGQPAAWEGLADSLAAAGNVREALSALTRAQQSLPRHAGLRAREAEALRALGRPHEARRAYESALPLAPRSAELRVRLGDLLRDLGRPDEAIARLREAIAIDPAAAPAWNSLGVVLGATGRAAEAEAAFQEAVRRDPRSYRYPYNLAFLLMQQQRATEARYWFQKSLEANPSFEPARERLGEIDGVRRRRPS